MADAAVSRYQAATLNPGDQRFLGEGNGAYQAPTRGQLFARSLGLAEGSDDYNTAIRDQEMGTQGPTAVGNRVNFEGIRQRNRAAMEGMRQAGRQTLRGMPTYRDTNSPPPRPRAPAAASRTAKVPTATGANGEKIYYRGGRWVDRNGRPVQ
jgi:hypothetical protein